MPNRSAEFWPGDHSWKPITDAVQKGSASSDSSPAFSDSSTDASQAHSESESAKGSGSSSDSEDSLPGPPPPAAADTGQASAPASGEDFATAAPPLSPPSRGLWSQQDVAADRHSSPQDWSPLPVVGRSANPFHMDSPPGTACYMPPPSPYEPTAWGPFPRLRPAYPDCLPTTARCTRADEHPAACTCRICAPSFPLVADSLLLPELGWGRDEKQLSQPAASRQGWQRPASPAYSPTSPQYQSSPPPYESTFPSYDGLPVTGYSWVPDCDPIPAQGLSRPYYPTLSSVPRATSAAYAAAYSPTAQAHRQAPKASPEVSPYLYSC